ncbi:MAG: TetR/AcrR family transcriptional regulator [Pseudomonadota bacterium]
MDEKLETRDCILKAAMDRILHYGYAKTTMSEIARDCDMSAGNIYRFFSSKLDIAEAMARKYATEVFQNYAAIARDQEKSATTRIQDIIAAGMERTYEVLNKDDKLLELAEVLSKERPDFANEELAQERVHLVKVLEDGMATGEFRHLDDPDFTAEIMQSATMKFRYPQLWSHLSIEQLRRELSGVLNLIEHSLKAPLTAPETTITE